MDTAVVGSHDISEFRLTHVSKTIFSDYLTRRQYSALFVNNYISSLALFMQQGRNRSRGTDSSRDTGGCRFAGMVPQ